MVLVKDDLQLLFGTNSNRVCKVTFISQVQFGHHLKDDIVKVTCNFYHHKVLFSSL